MNANHRARELVLEASFIHSLIHRFRENIGWGRGGGRRPLEDSLKEVIFRFWIS